MSTSASSATDPALAPDKLPNTLKLTREALYMLEACLRQGSGVTSTQQAILWEKVQRKCRRINDRHVKTSWDPAGHDLEKALLRTDNESDLAFARRSAEYRENHAVWQDE